MIYWEHLVEKYQSKGLLLDSNLLLLHLVGSIKPELIGSHRLTNFTITEIEILKEFAALFRRMVTTPHVLTEVSNLVNDWDAATREEIWTRFAAMLEKVEERTVSSYEAARRPEFCYLGLTDTVLASISNDFLIVSRDGRMVNHLRDRNMTALKWIEVIGLEA